MRKLSFFTKSVLLGLLLLALALIGTHPAISEEKPRGGWIKVGALLDLDDLDPAQTLRGNTRRVLYMLFDPLVRMKPGDPNHYPGLATSWEVSPDAKSITFKLRRDVKFHDGTPFNAQAVKFSLDRIGLKGFEHKVQKGTAIGAIGPYEGADVIDDYTVRVRFEEPYAPALTMLSLGVLSIVSPTAVKKLGADFSSRPVGTGPFIFKEWVKNDHVTVLRNPDYKWGGPIFKNQGPPYVDGVIWKIIPEDGTRAGTLESGETNIIEEVPTAYYNRLKDNQDIKLETATVPGVPVFVPININNFPTSELAVRQALRYAIDQELIVKTLYKGAFTPARSILDPATLGYNRELERYFTYDPDKAREILDRAGWKLGPDGIRVKDGKRLKLRHIIGPAFDIENVAPMLQAQWREVGIEVEIEKQSQAPFFTMIRRGDHHLTVSGWWYPDPHVMYSAFHSRFAGTGFNFVLSRIPELDKMLEEGYKTLGVERRAEIYYKAQEFLLERAAVIPIRRLVIIYGIRKNVHGLQYSQVAWPLFNDVYMDTER